MAPWQTALFCYQWGMIRMICCYSPLGHIYTNLTHYLQDYNSATKYMWRSMASFALRSFSQSFTEVHGEPCFTWTKEVRFSFGLLQTLKLRQSGGGGGEGDVKPLKNSKSLNMIKSSDPDPDLTLVWTENCHQWKSCGHSKLKGSLLKVTKWLSFISEIFKPNNKYSVPKFRLHPDLC